MVISIIAFTLISLVVVIFILFKGSKEEPTKPIETPKEEPSEQPKEETPQETPQETPKEERPFVPEKYLEAFKEIVEIKEDTKTYEYLSKLYFEACAQYGKSTYFGLPILFDESSFPQIYDFYGDKGEEDNAFKTLVGWLFAMQLAELRPQDRTAIYKIGYELGGYTKDSALYGWKFRCDPNICRLVAAAIWASMRGIYKPDIETMRDECGRETYVYIHDDITEIRYQNEPFEVEKDDFYVDLRKFMPTAPGPYAPNYKDRSAIGGIPYPNDTKTNDNNLAVDKAIRDTIINKYNIGYPDDQRTIQAIADKDANYNHLFGRTREFEHYYFEPVFTFETLGVEIYPSLAKDLCNFVDDVLHIGSYQRCILQGHEKQMLPYQYGRLRPGCSWKKEAQRHSYDNDTENILVDFDIEENDGNPTQFYDRNGEWVEKNGIHSPEEYNDVMKDELWANSYPSGHSAGISCVALLLIELLPDRANLILAAANRFAVNRTIARYHWNSDTIQGRVLATCIAPIIRCCSDWNERFEEAKKYLSHG